jgi:hypothetical protein
MKKKETFLSASNSFNIFNFQNAFVKFSEKKVIELLSMRELKNG